MKILFSDWMRDLDAEAIKDIGIPSIVLMENAASAAVSYITEKFPVDNFGKALIVAGPGNNGGDGITVGRKLFTKGYDVLIVALVDPEKYSGDPATNLKIVMKIGIPCEFIHDMETFNGILESFSSGNSFVVDAIFGTGLRRPVKDSFFSEVMGSLNGSGLKIFSIDVPSGTSDKISRLEGSRINADYTVTFQTLKISHLFPDYDNSQGKIRVADIGIPGTLLKNDKYYIELITGESGKPVLRTSQPGHHKGNYGHLLVVAGSPDKPGAAVMTSHSAIRSGAGLVTCVTPEGNIGAAFANHPEIMSMNGLSTEDLLEKASEFSAIVAGPGLGTGKIIETLIFRLIKEYEKPLILDADALNVFTGKPQVFGEKRGNSIVITPHPREFSRISGVGVKDIVEKPYKYSREFSMKFNLITVLKGHRTVVSTPEGKVYVNETGNSGMATAGSGDVLSGIISGLIARTGNKFDLEDIVKAAVFIHGFSGDLALAEKGVVGMTASDIIDSIPYAIERIDEFKSEFGIC